MRPFVQILWSQETFLRLRIPGWYFYRIGDPHAHQPASVAYTVNAYTDLSSSICVNTVIGLSRNGAIQIAVLYHFYCY